MLKYFNRISLAILIISLIYCKLIFAQDSTNYMFKFLPSGLHFQSLKANSQEAKIGVLYFPSNANLKIDLGNSIDIVSFYFPNDQLHLTFGIDFFAYALSTSFSGNRLQIDALDGLFGGNSVLSKKYGKDRLVIRFRILHNSAHLVDGHFNQNTDHWINDQGPIPFTKDFGELLSAYEVNYDFILFRYYGGLSYATLIRPATLKRWNFLSGIETVLLSLIGKVFNNPANIFASYNFLLNGENRYSGNSDFMLGIKFGGWHEKGIIFYTEYYSGQRRFNEYFREKIKEFGLGFYVDFF
jgi:hypothetical protein